MSGSTPVPGSTPTPGSTTSGDSAAPGLASASGQQTGDGLRQDRPAAYGQVPTGPGQYPVGSQPGEAVGMKGAIVNVFRKYAQFSGRASRTEYWWWALFAALVTVLAMVCAIALIGAAGAASESGGSAPTVLTALAVIVYGALMLFGLVTLVPNIAVAVRRLHDTNRSGWWYFIAFVPLVGTIILIVLLAREPHPAGAAYDAL